MTKFLETIYKALAWIRYGPISGAGWILVICVFAGSMTLGASGHYAARQYQQQRTLYGKAPLVWIDYLFPVTGTIGEALYKSIANQLGNIKIAASEEESSKNASESTGSGGAQSAQPVDTTGTGNTVSHEGPDYPRITNTYHGDMPWVNANDPDPWQITDGHTYNDYWRKIDMFTGQLGFGYNIQKDRTSYYDHLETNLVPLKDTNPNLIFIPYVNLLDQYIVSADPIPEEWYLHNAAGERQEIWPGAWRIDYPHNKSAIDAYLLNGVNNIFFNKSYSDGVFWDTFNDVGWPWDLIENNQAQHPDSYNIINTWNLPASGFERVNGAFAEEELNRILRGESSISYDEFLKRYILWTVRTRKPNITVFDMRPGDAELNPFVRAGWTDAQRKAEYRRASLSTLSVMRLGLVSALMGNGYYSYDYMHGGHWWYVEYDAPLGYPTSDATKYSDGTWRRTFDNGLVIANPTGAAIDVTLDREYQATITLDDGSTQTSHGTTFSIPSHDGRLFVPYGS